MLGMLDHEMHVEWQICFFADKTNNVRPKGNVIDEMSIHDVAMDPIRACGFDAVDFIAEPRKIGGKNGRRDDDSRHK